MPDIKKLAGGAPVPAEILVNVDHETIEGDGSENFPLRAVGGSSLFPVLPVATPGIGATVDLVASKTNAFNLTNGGAQKLRLPSALSVPNGTQFKIVFENGQDGSTLQYLATGDDTVNGVLLSQTFSGGSGAYGTDSFVSDGASTWWQVI